jgi:hypothetical protein
VDEPFARADVNASGSAAATALVVSIRIVAAAPTVATKRRETPIMVLPIPGCCTSGTLLIGRAPIAPTPAQ